MKGKEIFHSMIEIEREYYPETFRERKRKIKEEAVERTGVSLAKIAIEEVRDELEGLENVC